MAVPSSAVWARYMDLAANGSASAHSRHASPQSPHPSRWLPWRPVPELDAFPPDVIPKLKTYVCRLIDPRNSETFYVGKGQGNRVFAHIRDELSQDSDELSDKPFV